MKEELEETFYMSDEEMNDARLLSRLRVANESIDSLVIDEDQDALDRMLDALEEEFTMNKSGGLTKAQREERDLALRQAMTEEDREFLDSVDHEYYKRVKTSDEFYRRKKLILENLDRLQRKVEHQAKNYDEYAKLKFIFMEKARQKKSILKNF